MAVDSTLAPSGRPDDEADLGNLDPDIQMGIILNLIDLLVDARAPVTAVNVRAMAATFERRTDARLAASARQLAQMSLLGFLSPIQTPAGDRWEPTDNDFGQALRDDTRSRLAPIRDHLRARALRLARHALPREPAEEPAERSA